MEKKPNDNDNQKLPLQESMKQKKGFIILIDALGTKGASNSTYEQKRESLENTLTFYKAALDELNKIKKPFDLRSKIITFSDTAIITVPIDSYEQLHVEFDMLGDYLNTIMIKALQNQIYCRGAVTVGSFLVSELYPFILGPAIDEVASWYEESDWIGIHATPSLQIRLSVPLKEKDIRTFICYDIPMKDSSSKSWALNWPYAVYEKYFEGGKDEDEIKKGRAIERISTWLLSSPIDKHTFAKYKNTLKFIYKSLLEQDLGF